MECYECAKQSRDVSAVVVCRGCGAGLCMEHLHEEATRTVGGLNVSCDHDTWRPTEAAVPASATGEPA